jgi:thioredoxin 1
MAIKLTDANMAEMLEKNKITIVDFWAEWCGPCRILGPIIDELADVNLHVTIGKLNVDENQATAIKYGIRGIPTVLFFNDGVLVEKVVGVKPKAELQALIDKLNT